MSRSIKTDDFNYVHETQIAFSGVYQAEPRSFKKITMRVHVLTGNVVYQVTYRLGAVEEHENQVQEFVSLHLAIDCYNSWSDQRG